MPERGWGKFEIVESYNQPNNCRETRGRKKTGKLKPCGGC